MPDYKQRPNICFYQHVDDCDNCYIELFENFPCNSKEELCKKGQVIREIGTKKQIVIREIGINKQSYLHLSRLPHHIFPPLPPPQ